MEILIPVYFTVLGAIVGSFLNVLIIRYGTGMSIAGRSSCLSCRQALAWYDLIPIVSFLILSGRCRACKTSISLQYPIVEFLTAIVFLLVSLRVYTGSLHSLADALMYASIFSVLIAIAVYDVRHKIVPDGLVYVFIFLSFILAFLHFLSGGLASEFHSMLLAGPILFIPFFLLWFLSKGRLMGLGDGKLVFGIGWLLGISLGASAVTLGFWIGAGVSVFALLISRLKRGGKQLTMKSEIPFAPFLILGTLIVFLTHLNLFSLGAMF